MTKFKLEWWHGAIAVVILFLFVKMGGIGYIGAVTGLCTYNEPSSLDTLKSTIKSWEIGNNKTPDVVGNTITWNGKLNLELTATSIECTDQLSTLSSQDKNANDKIKIILTDADGTHEIIKSVPALEQWTEISIDLTPYKAITSFKFGMVGMDEGDYFFVDKISNETAVLEGFEDNPWTSTSVTATKDSTAFNEGANSLKVAYLNSPDMLVNSIGGVKGKTLFISYLVPAVSSELASVSSNYEKDKRIVQINSDYYICTQDGKILVKMNDASLKDAYLDAFVQCAECKANVDKEKKTCDDGTSVNYRYCGTDGKWIINESCPVKKTTIGTGTTTTTTSTCPEGQELVDNACQPIVTEPVVEQTFVQKYKIWIFLGLMGIIGIGIYYSYKK